MTKLKGPHPLEDIPTAVGSFFLDSGAHSIYTREVIDKKHQPGEGKYKFYTTDEFYAYCDSYAGFIKRFGWAIDFYANVDAIFEPDVTWKIQQYLEKEHGLKPVPVIHHGTDIKWIHHYLERGYDFLGIGGLGQEVTKDEYYAWADRVFHVICPAMHNKMPLVKTHGFAMTSWDLMRRYPWWSVDSASWIKAAAFGTIYIPHMRGGEFTFEVKPYALTVSGKSPNMKAFGKHIKTISHAEREVVLAWLGKLGIPLGKQTNDDPPVELERGVLTHHKPRAEANLRYFMAMCDSLPKWPWPFKQINRGVGLGL